MSRFEDLHQYFLVSLSLLILECSLHLLSLTSVLSTLQVCTIYHTSIMCNTKMPLCSQSEPSEMWLPYHSCFRRLQYGLSVFITWTWNPTTVIPTTDLCGTLSGSANYTVSLNTYKSRVSVVIGVDSMSLCPPVNRLGDYHLLHHSVHWQIQMLIYHELWWQQTIVFRVWQLYIRNSMD